jgi:ketosteroid isomerase-like protein
MSQDNVEIVRRIYDEEWFYRDPERFLDLAAPNVEYVNPPEAIDPGIRRGRAELARALRNLSQSFESYRHEVHELFYCGDSVVASVTVIARAHGSDAEIVQDGEAHTWTLHDGKIVRHEWGRDLKAALEAAGPRE